MQFTPKTSRNDRKLVTSSDNSLTSEKERRHGLVSVELPTIHLTHLKRNFGKATTRVIQERLAHTLHSTGEARHKILSTDPWPNRPWHYRALVIQFKSLGGNKLVDLSTTFSPWIANKQYPKGSTDQRSRFSVNIIYSLYTAFSQCAKIWGIPMGGILQETVEDLLLTRHYYNEKLKHWQDIWDKYCEQPQKYYGAVVNGEQWGLWRTHFHALQHLWVGSDGNPISKIPNIYAHYRNTGRVF